MDLIKLKYIGVIMFDSVLPININWNEINVFFDENKTIVNTIVCRDWFENEVFKNNDISKNTLDVLGCLHKDLYNCYTGGIFVLDEQGREDRTKEYQLLKEYLFSKYDKISHCVLNNIYHTYLRLDR